jgi:hypothetical protein
MIAFLEAGIVDGRLGVDGASSPNFHVSRRQPAKAEFSQILSIAGTLTIAWRDRLLSPAW